MTYAKGTSVSPEKSMAEIREILKRYKAAKVATMEEENGVGIAFEMAGRRVRFAMTLPAPSQTQRTATGRTRKGTSLNSAHEQAIRERWRALTLVIKAKLEAVESGIETFDEAFMAQLILPGSNATVSEWLAPQITKAYADGGMPMLLSSGGKS